MKNTVKTIAITGGIGSGKSAVSAYLRHKDYTVIDADAISRNLTAARGEAIAPIREAFGDKVFAKDGSLNRSALADIVFSDKDKLSILNSIMHPLILRDMLSLIKENCANQAKDDHVISIQNVLFAEVPLLYELGWQRYFDCVWLVTCPLEVRIERAIKRDNSSAQKVRMRMDNQADMDMYKDVADKLIDNGASIEELHANIDILLNGLNQ